MLDLKNLSDKKPYDDPILSFVGGYSTDERADRFMFVWDIFGKKRPPILEENLKELGPLSVASTIQENINIIIEDFIPYNVGFIKYLYSITEEGKVFKSFVYPEERLKILREHLEKIFIAFQEGKFDSELEKNIAEDWQHFSLMFNVFVSPAEEGRTIFDIKEENSGEFPLYNEALSIFGHYSLITYQKGLEKEIDIKPINLSSIGLTSTYF